MGYKTTDTVSYTRNLFLVSIEQKSNFLGLISTMRLINRDEADCIYSQFIARS